MNCKNCSAGLDINSKFCEKCGHKVSPDIKSSPGQKTEKQSPVMKVVSVIIFILAIGVGRYLTQGNLSFSTTQSKVDIINKAVSDAKNSLALPKQIDDITTLTDITAEPDAILYHYTLTAGVDTTNLSNDYLKNYLHTNICQTKETKNLLDNDINMEYSYTVENSHQSYYVLFTKADC